MNITLNVFYENPFWVGIFEKNFGNSLEVARIVFGKEPKDAEVYEFILKHYNSIKFSSPVKEVNTGNKRINPKRLQREIKKQIQNCGVGTKSQNALKLEYESSKKQRKEIAKAKREEEEKLKFQLKQQKKKDKKRGH
ncbi:YjdF family protein [Clostridium neuense]|uniref:YjdF family protein n=1 Tax=Clostridium neuense TaxID=1728934 RepID=A0ABW8TC44_9CLOT